MADRIGRIATIGAVLALGAIGLALPDSILVGGLAWLAFLFFVASGWGWLVVRIARVEDPDVGLRSAWGIAGYLGVAGPLVMLGVCSRIPVLALVAVGAAGFAWRELSTPEPLHRALRAGIALARSRPVVAYLAILLGAAVVAQMIGAVVHLDRNPWDDDIVYTPFVKRLLDTGDLIEPFSFRRLASYGGQSVLQELVGARGSMPSVHALDHGLCAGITFLLLLGHARSLRTSSFWLALVAIVVVMLPDISTNTASYWSGAVAFYALYRTVAAGRLVLATFVAATACTLRANYIPVAVVFVLLALFFELQRGARATSWRDAWRGQRATWARAIGIGALVLIPWCIAAFASSRTFLFPVMSGTWNHGITLGPPGWSWVDELSLFALTAIDSRPIVVALLLAPLIACTRDDRLTRPLPSLFVACVIGFALMTHSFTDADAGTLWRYAFGYFFPLFVAFVIEAGSDDDRGPVRLAPLGRWLLVAALLVQLAASRSGQAKIYAAIGADLREAVANDRHGDPNARVEAARYAAMQAAVPVGARMLVMVDDPAFLDFDRNRIANLDIPGFASPGAQLPSFMGAEALRSYLLDEGYRYVAFVRPDRSRYAFRRGFWVWRIFNDTPFFQAMSAYAIDAIDTLLELEAASSVRYDTDGLTVLDLERPHGSMATRDIAREAERRDAFIGGLATREHLDREWALTSRRHLVFSDGLSNLTFAQADADAHWFDFFVVDPKPTRGVPIRWMYRRTHLKLTGDRDMHLVLRGHVNMNLLYTHPRLDVSLDGAVLTSVTVDDAGAFTIDLQLTQQQLAGWSDLYIVFNAIGQPERDVKELRLARLEDVTWEPR